MATEAMYEVPGTLLDELRELRKIGDTLQSAASRMAWWIDNNTPTIVAREVPYEVKMAGVEARDCIEKWTETRKPSR